MTYAATPLVFLIHYNSPMLMGVASAVGYGGSILFGAIGAPIVDRWSRRTIMLACDALRAIVLLAVGLTLAQAEGLPPAEILIAAVAVVAVLSAAFNATSAAVLPDLVSREDFGAAMSFNQARDSTVAVAAPLAGAALAGADPALPFLVDGTSYLVSLACLWRIATMRMDGPQDQRSSTSYFRSLLDGWVALSRDRQGRDLVALTSLLNAALSFMVLVVIARAASEVGGLASGAFIATQSLCGLIGATVASRLYHRLPSATAFQGHCAFWILAMIGIAFSPNVGIAAACASLIWITAPLARLIVNGHLIEAHPPDRRGRILALYQWSVAVSATCGPLLAAVAIENDHETGFLLSLAAASSVLLIAWSVSTAVRVPILKRV